jgi:hypothetical protein
MATLREIKQRIKGIKSTQQITKAMKMVAAAKMRFIIYWLASKILNHSFSGNVPFKEYSLWW